MEGNNVKEKEIFILPKRAFVYAIISFGTGIFVSTNTNIQFMSKTVAVWLTVLAALLVILGSVCYLSKKPTEIQKRIVAFVCLLSVFFVSGLLRVHIFEDINPAWRGLNGKKIEVCGSIISKPGLSDSGKSYGFIFEVDKAVIEGKEEKIGENIRLYIPLEYSDDLKDGAGIRCIAKLSDYDSASYDGGYSMRKYYLQDNCRYLGYAQDKPEEYQKEGFDLIGIWRRMGSFLKDSILASVDNVLYIGDENALLKGILTGDKDGLSDDVMRDMSRSGFSHIASVSGMHVNYLFMALIFLFNFLRLRKGVCFCLSIPILLLFMSVAAFTPSVCRSIIVMTIYIIAYLIQREPDSVISLFVAGFLLLIYNPYIMYSVSFVLSFSATLGLLIFAIPIKNRIPNFFKKRIVLNFFCDSVAISASGMLGVSFFVAYYFNTISLAGIITNIWAPLFCALLFFLGYANWIVFLISPFLSKFFSLIIFILSRILVWSTSWLSSSFMVIDVPTPPKSFFLVYLVVMAIFYYLLKDNENKI